MRQIVNPRQPIRRQAKWRESQVHEVAANAANREPAAAHSPKLAIFAHRHTVKFFIIFIPRSSFERATTHITIMNTNVGLDPFGQVPTKSSQRSSRAYCL
jgi:hypothetical protein